MSAEPTGKAGFGLPISIARPIADALAVCVTLIAIAWSLNVVGYLGIGFYPQQFIAWILAFALPIVFLTIPFRPAPGRLRVPLYDCVAAALAFGALAWIAVAYPTVVALIFSRPPSAWVPGVIVTVLLLDALRRTTGWALVIIVIVFLLYAMFGNLVPGPLAGRAQDWRMLSGYMAYDTNGIMGTPAAVAATVVVAFILFGNLLTATGGSKFFTDAALLGMGRFRGGSMKIAVLASMLFGSVSGSAVANVVATGVVTIPMIKRDGYPAHKAGAIEAVASTGGQLMPPVMGAAAFLMAEFLQISYGQVALAALMPSLLYYLALFVQADLEAARLGISRVPASDIPAKAMVLRGFHFLLAFVVLIYGLFSLNWQPERAALAASLAAIVTAYLFGYHGVRPKLREVLGTIAATGHGSVEILVISAAAGFVIGVLNITGLSFNLTYELVQFGGGNATVLLVMSAILCVVLGMGLPTLGVYVLLAALVAPAIIETGIDPIAAHLFVLYFGMMSMITPPVAIAAFAAASIAKASAMETGFAAVRFGWVAFIVPFLFVFSPTLILIGEPMDIALALATAALGVWLVSAALAGYLFTRLTLPGRVLFAVAGVLSLIPAGAFPGAVYTDIVGVIGGLVLIGIEFARARAARPAAVHVR
jgi:TRAP transporter 4TM/12TM fusion protein